MIAQMIDSLWSLSQGFRRQFAIRTLGGPEKMAIVAKKIPVGRYGEPDEAAHTAVTFLDGRNMFATGMFVPMAGGYNVESCLTPAVQTRPIPLTHVQ